MSNAVFGAESKYYPYGKVQASYFDLSQLPLLPKKISDYLIDAPNPNDGYAPEDNNSYPRCRLWKYLFYDGADPLKQNLPSISEKMSVVFNPALPEKAPTEKGYRLIPQIFTKPSQVDAQTLIYFYIGRMVPSNDEFKACVSVNFIIFTHYQYEANTQTQVLSRVSGIEQALVEALHGVNMTGIGTFFFSRAKHPDCGSEELWDGNTNIGRRLTIAVELETTTGETPDPFSNMPFLDGNIRMA